MNKKGSEQFGSFVMYLIHLLPVILFIVLAFFYLGGQFDVNLTKTAPQLEPTIMIHRLVYSPNCFAYQDVGTLRTYPLVIDISKFNQEQLNICFNHKKGLFMELKSLNPSFTYEKQLQTKNWDGEEFIQYSKRVLILDDGLYDAELKVKVENG